MSTLEYILKKYNISFDGNTVMPIEIPNVTRLDILRWLRELDFQTGVEIGVAEGEYSKLLCESNPQMKLYGIDPFRPYRGYSDYTRDNTFSLLFNEAQRRLKFYLQKGVYEFVKEFSADALSRFDDNSLDFVYIDANHKDPFVTQDITEWSKKVKPGGIIAGHDYVKVGREGYDVVDAVNRFTRDNQVRPWFVLGLRGKIPKLIRDRYRSWFWVKE